MSVGGGGSTLLRGQPAYKCVCVSVCEVEAVCVRRLVLSCVNIMMSY